MALARQVVGGLALASEASAVKLLTQDMLQVGCARVTICMESPVQQLAGSSGSGRNEALRSGFFLVKVAAYRLKADV